MRNNSDKSKPKQKRRRRRLKGDEYGSDEFRQFALENNLRLETCEDGLPIVQAGPGDKWVEAHLFDGFGNERVGLYVKTATACAMSHMESRLTGNRTAKGKKPMKCKPKCLAETEATFTVAYKDLLPPIQFFRFAKSNRVSNLK